MNQIVPTISYPLALLAQLSQGSEDGWDWSSLLYLFILIVLPLVNAIKDKFVRRAEAKRQEQEAQRRAGRAARGRVPALRPVEPAVPPAKPMPHRAGQ